MRFQDKRVLIFGDSLSHRGSDSGPTVQNGIANIDRNVSAPGDLFASYLLQYGGAKSVRIDAKVGRSAYNFFTTREPWQALLENDIEYKPNIVFIILGTNDLNMGLGPSKTKFELLRSYFKTSPTIIAVGPPSFASTSKMNSAEGVVTMLKSVFGADSVIDSRPLTTDLTQQGRTGDKVHFTPAGAQLFARRLFEHVSRREGIVLPPEIEPTESTSALRLFTKYNLAKDLALGFGVIGSLALIGFLIFKRFKNQ